MARTHEMSMDIVTFMMCSLHESVLKTDTYLGHAGYRAKLFTPKRMRNSAAWKKAKSKVFHQSMFLILKVMRRLEQEGFLVNILPGNALPLYKRFFPVIVRWPCDVEEAYILNGVRKGTLKKLQSGSGYARMIPHLFYEIPITEFATISYADITPGSKYAKRTEPMYLHYWLQAKAAERTSDGEQILKEHGMHDCLPATFGFEVDVYDRTTVSDDLHNKFQGIYPHINNVLKEMLLTTDGMIALINERSLALSSFGANIIGIDMFDRGNITGLEKAVFYDYFPVLLIECLNPTQKAEKGSLLKKVIQLLVKTNDLLAFQNKPIHTEASILVLQSKILEVRDLYRTTLTKQKSKWCFPKCAYMLNFGLEVALSGSCKNTDCGQFERQMKHFTQFYSLTNHNPYDLPRQVHVRWEQLCSVESIISDLKPADNICNVEKTQFGLIQKAEKHKTDMIAALSEVELLNAEPIGYAFPTHSQLFNYKVVDGKAQVHAGMLRTPSNIYHKLQPELAYVDYCLHNSNVIDSNHKLLTLRRVNRFALAHTDVSTAQTVAGRTFNKHTQSLCNSFIKVIEGGDEEFFYISAVFVMGLVIEGTTEHVTQCCVFGRWLKKCGEHPLLDCLQLKWEPNIDQSSPCFNLPDKPHYDCLRIDSVLNPASIVPLFIDHKDVTADSTIHLVNRYFILSKWGSAIGVT